LTWGWRVPFALSLILVLIGLWIRLGILETPTFRRLLEEDRIERAPMLEAWRKHPKEIIVSAFARMAENGPFYVFTAFVFSYTVGILHLSYNFVLISMLVASVVSWITVPLAGYLSDRFGRRRIYILGAVLTGLYGFLYIWMLDTRSPVLVFLAIVISLIPHDLMYGPQAALIAESFTGRLRYSGASLGYQLASIVAGGPAPLIATALFAAYKTGYAIAWYIFAAGVISVIATLMLKDYTNKDISAEYDHTH
jgi:MFS family permease